MNDRGERTSMTAALVYYARIVGDGERAGRRTPGEICRRIEGVLGTRTQLCIDVMAAGECLFILEVLGETEVLLAVREIYVKPFSKSPLRTVTKNEISMRVLRFATENHLDERTVYRRLRRARELWHRTRDNLINNYK